MNDPSGRGLDGFGDEERSRDSIAGWLPNLLDCCMPTESSRDGGIAMDHLVQTDDAAHGILHRAGSGGSALPRPDNTQATVWALQE